MAMYFASKALLAIRGRGPQLRGTGRDGDLRMSRSTDRLSGCEYEWPQLLHHDQTGHRVSLPLRYRRMMRGSTLAYHGPLTKAGALAERVLPRALTRRIAAFMNGGKPHRLKV